MTDRPKPLGNRKRGKLPGPGKPISESPDNSNGAGRRQAAGSIPANGGSNGSAAEIGDLTELAVEAARNAPEIREKLIARYRKSIKDGRYAPDLEGVAERMIREGLLKDL